MQLAISTTEKAQLVLDVMSWWDMFFYWMPTVTTGCKKNFAGRFIQL